MRFEYLDRQHIHEQISANYELDKHEKDILTSCRNPTVNKGELNKSIFECVELPLDLSKVLASNSLYLQSVNDMAKLLERCALDELFNILLFDLIQKKFSNHFDVFQTDSLNWDSFSKHSIFTAIVARRLAKFLGLRCYNALFQAGLMHDLGRLIMMRHHSESFKDVLSNASDSPQLLFKSERRILGFDHSYFSHVLTSHWGFDESIQGIVKNHHSPSLEKNYRLETAILHFADIIAHSVGPGSSGEVFVPTLSIDLKRLKLGQSQLEQLCEDSVIEFSVLASTQDMELVEQ